MTCLQRTRALGRHAVFPKSRPRERWDATEYADAVGEAAFYLYFPSVLAGD